MKLADSRGKKEQQIFTYEHMLNMNGKVIWDSAGQVFWLNEHNNNEKKVSKCSQQPEKMK